MSTAAIVPILNRAYFVHYPIYRTTVDADGRVVNERKDTPGGEWRKT